jgi:hypothetical protein
MYEAPRIIASLDAIDAMVVEAVGTCGSHCPV